MAWVCPDSLGGNWGSIDSCDAISTIITAINNICSYLETLSGTDGGEVAIVPPGEVSTNFATYFEGGVVKESSIVVQGTILWSTPDFGATWTPLTIYNPSNEVVIVPGGTLTTDFNTYFPSSTPATYAIVVRGISEIWTTDDGGTTWTQIYMDNEVRVVPAGELTANFATYFINGIPNLNSIVLYDDGTGCWITPDSGSTWVPFSATSCPITSDSLANIQTLESTNSLVPGCMYRINDNTSAEGGDILFIPFASDKIPETVIYENSTTGEQWPAVYNSSTGDILKLQDGKGNVVIGSAAVDGFDWNNANWADNYIHGVGTWTGSGGTFEGNHLYNLASLDITSNSGTIDNCHIVGGIIDFSTNSGSISYVHGNVSSAVTVTITGNTNLVQFVYLNRPTTVSITANSGTVGGLFMMYSSSAIIASNTGTVTASLVNDNSQLDISGNAGLVHSNFLWDVSDITITTADALTNVTGNIFNQTTLTASNLTGCNINNNQLGVCTVNMVTMDDTDFNQNRAYSNATITLDGADTVTVQGCHFGYNSNASWANMVGASIREYYLLASSVSTMTGFTGNILDADIRGTSLFNASNSAAILANIRVHGSSSFNVNNSNAFNGTDIVIEGDSLLFADASTTATAVVRNVAARQDGTVQINGLDGSLLDTEVRCGFTLVCDKDAGFTYQYGRVAGNTSYNTPNATNETNHIVND
jgi:hypothetical protein